MMFTILGLGRGQIGLLFLLLDKCSHPHPNSHSVCSMITVQRDGVLGSPIVQLCERHWLFCLGHLPISGSITLARKIN